LTVPVAIPTSPVTQKLPRALEKLNDRGMQSSLLTSSPTAFFRIDRLLKKVPA
jgi:hypothetical protein